METHGSSPEQNHDTPSKQHKSTLSPSSPADAKSLSAHILRQGLGSKRKACTDDSLTSFSASKRSRPAYTKHQVHNNADGNTLVLVENTMYNLYKGQLVKLSGWFKNFFENPIFTEMEGKNVIILDKLGVTPKDLEAFLDALDHPMYVSNSYFPPNIL
jgi:hypothetical protein